MYRLNLICSFAKCLIYSLLSRNANLANHQSLGAALFPFPKDEDDENNVLAMLETRKPTNEILRQTANPPLTNA